MQSFPADMLSIAQNEVVSMLINVAEVCLRECRILKGSFQLLSGRKPKNGLAFDLNLANPTCK